MPFDDLGGDNDDFFADGVVEEITAALSRIKDFFVIARQSAYTYKGRFVDVREVGPDLCVAYAVAGSVRRGGRRVRITVQPVYTDAGRPLWPEPFPSASPRRCAWPAPIHSPFLPSIYPPLSPSPSQTTPHPH